ncbi:hypothetical protein A4X13_0g3185 [Tilletia indica]|uniref:YjgF-like protein n=1 Tax=Tilletia indica TaxID=43049 RepID=A0A177TGV9_9BASI|nr:hypothetical protein A4X13_0g3185 [Tilletia indica]
MAASLKHSVAFGHRSLPRLALAPGPAHARTYVTSPFPTGAARSTGSRLPYASHRRISAAPSVLYAVRPPTPASVRMSSSTVYKVASTDKAPKAIGPYSQATIHNGLVFCSGCIPFDPVKMECVEGGIEAQTQRALDNLFAVLEASGSDKSHVLKTTVFLKDMNDFAKVNGVYEAAFAPYKPARSAVEVARLPRDVLVEVEAIAAVKA